MYRFKKRTGRNSGEIMGRTEKTILLLAVVFCLCMAATSLVGCENNSNRGFGNQSAGDAKAFEDDYTTQKARTEADYSDIYPYYGMREEALGRCALGEPASVEPCRDFNGLVPRARYKTYVFGIYGKPLSGKFTVRYRWHYSHRVDDYQDLPATNGYVDWGWYVDSDGVRYDVDQDGTKPHQYPSEKDGSGQLDNKQIQKKKNHDEIDPDDHDIEAYYEDNKDIYDSYEDAWDGFEDDEDAWDEY